MMNTLASPRCAASGSFREDAGGNLAIVGQFGIGASVLTALWCAFFLLSPVYLMPSGSPQVADFLILILLAVLWMNGSLRIPRKAFPIVNAMSLFVGYVAIVDLVWMVLLCDIELVRYPMFFAFNFVVCLVFLSLYQCYGRTFLLWTAVALCVSILIQSLLSLHVMGSGRIRVAGLFNNPNQAAYYALLCASLFWVWCESVRLPRALAGWLPLCVYGGAAYLIVLSLSRAALGAMAILMLLAGIRNKTVLLAGLLAVSVLALPGIEWNQVDEFENRVEKKSRGFYEETMSRGYDRMLNHPQYLLLGAGEGAQYRIISQRPAEMHSSLGTVLFCYGAVGMILFLYVFWVMAKGCGVASLLYLLPAALYGTTHMGLRQSELWVLPMMVVCLKWPEMDSSGRQSCPATSRLI